MTADVRKQYAALLAQHDALIHGEDWDRERERELSRKMMALVRSHGPGSKRRTEDEDEAHTMQLEVYLRRVGV